MYLGVEQNIFGALVNASDWRIRQSMTAMIVSERPVAPVMTAVMAQFAVRRMGGSMRCVCGVDDGVTCKCVEIVLPI